MTAVTANSKREEQHIGISAPFEKVCERNNTQHVLNTNGETRNNIPDVVSELSAPGTDFDGQPHTHHDIMDFHQNFFEFCFRK